MILTLLFGVNLTLGGGGVGMGSLRGSLLSASSFISSQIPLTNKLPRESPAPCEEFVQSVVFGLFKNNHVFINFFLNL